jgi:hypothetical protein
MSFDLNNILSPPSRYARSTDADNIRPIFKSRRRGVAGYYSRCPSGKSKTIRFISAVVL